MTKTNAEIRNRVAEDLGVKATDMDLADEDAAKIEARIASTRAFLLQRGLAWWPDGQIPDECEDGYAMMVRAMACASFGKRNQGHEAGWREGWDMIAAVKPSDNVEQQAYEYY